MKLHAVTLAAALLSPVVFAAASAQAPATSQDPQDEIVCTTDQHTGSHIPHKTCMTRKQREERAREDQKSMESMRSHSGSGKSPAGTAP